MFREFVVDFITDCAFAIIKFVNVYSDRCLAARLYRLGFQYDPKCGSELKDYVLVEVNSFIEKNKNALIE